MPPVYAGELGVDAFNYLARPRGGHIVSRFREGVAVLFDEAADAGLISLQTTRRPLHPWSIVLPEVGSLWVGLRCASNGSCLKVGAQWRIVLTAERADPLTIPTWASPQARCAFARIGELQDVLDQNTPSPADNVFTTPENSSLASRHLRDVLDQLVGWGPGSTPSGDDFAVGQLATLWALAAVSPRAVHQIKGIQNLLRWDRLQERTPLGSAQMLISASNGHFCRAACAFMRSLGQTAPHSMKPASRCVLSLGASSGRAMLAGLIDGLRRASHMDDGRHLT